MLYAIVYCSLKTGSHLAMPRVSKKGCWGKKGLFGLFSKKAKGVESSLAETNEQKGFARHHNSVWRQ